MIQLSIIFQKMFFSREFPLPYSVGAVDMNHICEIHFAIRDSHTMIVKFFTMKLCKVHAILLPVFIVLHIYEWIGDF